MLVAAEVVSLVGMLAVDNLTAVAVAAVTRVTMAVRTLSRACVVVAGRSSLDMVVGFAVVGVVLRLVLFHGIVVARLLTGVESSTMMVRVLEVLWNRTLVSGVSNSTAVAMAARVRSRLELLFGSSVLVLSVVVQVMTVAATGRLVVSLVSGAANLTTSVDGVGIDLVAVKILRLFNESGKGCRALVATVVVAVAVAVTVTVTMTVDMVTILVVSMRVRKVMLSGACNCCKAGKGESLKHFEFLGKRSKSRYLRPEISPFDPQREYYSYLMPPLFLN